MCFDLWKGLCLLCSSFGLFGSAEEAVKLCLAFMQVLMQAGLYLDAAAKLLILLQLTIFLPNF